MLNNETQNELHKIFSENLLQWIPTEILKTCIIENQTNFLVNLEQKGLKLKCKTIIQSLEIPELTNYSPSHNIPLQSAIEFYNQSLKTKLISLCETNLETDVYANFYAYLLALSKSINLSFNDAFSLEMNPYLEKFNLRRTENSLMQ
jgi:hypothetical protein